MSLEESFSGGFDASFTEPLEQRYSCPVCLAALRHPMQTKCGHRFCKLCLERCAHSSRFARCPVDNQWFDVRREVFSDVATAREVLSLPVRCDNHGEGCAWSGELRSLEEHNLTCPDSPVVCSNSCGVTCKRGTLDTHLMECPRREGTCQYCQQQVVIADLTKHQLLVCTKFPVDCTLCGKSGILREEISSHINPTTGDCPLVIIKCPYAHIGCYFQDKRKHMAAHHKKAGDHHVQLLSMKIAQQDETILRQSRDIQQLSVSCRHLSDIVRQQESRLRDQSDLLDEMGTDIYELSSCSWNGELLWKVPVPEDQTQSILSPYIFTGRPGYKTQLKLDIHGVREGDEWFSTVTLVVHKGHMDNFLRFPVDLSCDITAIDQSPRSSRHLESSGLLSNLQQAPSDNTPTKAPSHKLIETKHLLTRFCKDNVVFLVCKVTLVL